MTAENSEVCQNSYVNCEKYTKINPNYCKDTSFFRYNCRKSCNFCDTPIVDWRFHKDRKCPEEHKHGLSYTSLEDARNACEKDPNCGYVYDWKCDSSAKIKEIQLCKKFLSSELEHSPIDCVYEVKKQE